MESIERLSEMFIRFPGIGPRQAKRFVYFVLRQDSEWIDAFIRELSTVRKSSAVCSLCRRRFVNAKDVHVRICPICADESRAHETLMVLEKEVDFETVEKSRAYHGQYFLLGGIISPLEEEKAEPAIKALEKRIADLQKNGLSEVIIALSATSEGDDTAAYLHERLVKSMGEKNITLTTLGRGLSTGSEIEYADSKTLKDALSRRVKLD